MAPTMRLARGAVPLACAPVRRVPVVAIGLALLLVGCSGGGSDRPSLARHATPAPTRCTAPLFASPVNCVARPVGQALRVFSTPTAADPSWTFPNPWLLNNDPSVLGKDISHGCIRMSNDKITYLASVLPLGTPVQISA